MTDIEWDELLARWRAWYPEAFYMKEIDFLFYVESKLTSLNKCSDLGFVLAFLIDLFL